MSTIFLTQHPGAILGPIAQILGWVMNLIFNFLDNLFNIQNIGLVIILFTIIIYLLMLPLTVKQQKFSKLSAKMNPEIQAIQKKYKDKKDQASMMRMQEETKAVQAKYGVSQVGGCLQLIIQMPILFALYRVIYNIPAYVAGVKDVFMGLVNALLSDPNAQEVLLEIGTAKNISPDKFDYTQANTIVDILYKFQSADWLDLAEKFPDLSELIQTTAANLSRMNNFLGINIADAPISNLMSFAILIPILAGVTQWLNMRLMPQASSGSKPGEENSMEASMKSVNNVMPIMSIVFCLTLPAGIGLYWIAGSVIRSILQLIINKYFDRVDVDELVKKNMEKANVKREKKGLPPQKVSTIARTNLKSIEEPKTEISDEEKKESVKNSTDYYNKNAKPGSIASKANMVKMYNEKNKS